MKIKVKYLSPIKPIEISEKGEWIDLRCAKTVNLYPPEMIKDSGGIIRFSPITVPLGIAMKLPKGFEAIIAPRSSSYKNYGFMLANSIGVIDNSYCGNDDQWRVTLVSFKQLRITQGDRIVQFRIQLSQFASVWTKIKWLFTRKIEFVPVSDLKTENRGGIGSTGKS